MTNRDTFAGMVERAISVRLDEEAQRALDKLIGSGMSQSQAIRYALIQTADRERPRMSLSAEAMMLAANEEDRRIKVELLEFMGEPSESR
jgi:Arc/MetJ-type ribon-helix-helix transcriptional regulator